MKKGLLLLLVLLFAACVLRAQEAVRFGEYTVVPEQNVALRTRGGESNSLADVAPVNGRVNALVQFKEKPSGVSKDALRKAGVTLDGYVGGNAYFAQLPQGMRPMDLARFDAVSVIGVRPEWKVSRLLAAGRVPDWARRGDGVVAVRLSWFANVDSGYVCRYAESRGYRVGYVSRYFSSATLEVPLADVKELAAESWVRRVAPVPPPEVALNRDGVTLSGGNLLSLPYGQGGRGLSGKGVRIGLWDGNVERHVDFGDRLHVLEYDYSVAASESHGIHTAGTIAGAGLLDPRGRGVAPGAEIYSMNFSTSAGERSEVEEMVSAREQYNIALTSNSYGPSLQLLCSHYNKLSYSFLGSDAERDMLACAEPTLIHIYAAGNDQGGCDGRRYGSSASRAKNVIYVGAVDKHGRMSGFSSWGPMDDGRLIPTLCAKGVGTLSTVHGNGYELMDGTSMACPAVAGHVALLVERYHQLHGGQHPNSALVKGLLANTADDKGNAGPDYQYGYGVLNAPAALRALENKWYAAGRVERGVALAPVRIDVPSGVKQLRVMLTWLDPAPADKEFAYGEKALVNDLDLSVSLGGVTQLPYVLNPLAPEEAATRGVDDCNNIEQVIISGPSAGVAEVIIGGHDKVREGEAQDYVLTWYFDYGFPELLCPIGGEVYSPGDEMLVRADNLEGRGTVEISYDNGESFHFVASTRAGVDFYSVSIPVPSDAPATSMAKLRLIDAKGHVLVSPRTFTVAGRPQDILFTSSGCDVGSWKLSWEPVVGASSYVVLRADVSLGAWEKVGETAENSYSLPEEEAKRGGRLVYAVAVKLEGEALGPRSRGVIAEGAVPRVLTVEDLPFFESFTALPLGYATVEVGDSLLVEYADTPSELGLPMGSRMLVATTLSNSSAEPFAESSNTLTLRVCKMDLRGVPAGTPLLFYANVLQDSKGSASMTRLRLRANGEVVALAGGKTALSAAEATTDVYWDVSRYAGQQEVTLELQYSSHTVFSRLYLLGYALQEGASLPDVGVHVWREAVVDGPHMGKVKVPMTVYNSSLQAAERVPVVVRLDGEVRGSAVVESLQPYEQRQVEVLVDFSTRDPHGQIYDVEVRVEVPGDVDSGDNVRRFDVYSMGEVLAHPVTGIFEIPGLLRRCVDPRHEVAVDGSITYVDMGGQLKGYLPEQDASIRFYPSDRTKSVMITFKSWSLDTRDKIEVYSGTLTNAFDYDDAVASCELEGESEGVPEVVVSSAADGSLYVHFTASARGVGARGWEAEVTTVERVNALTLLPLAFESYYEDEVVPVELEIRNNAGIDIADAKAVINVGEDVAEVEIEDPLLAGQVSQVPLGELELPVPSLTDVEVTLVSRSDIDRSDNTQRVYIRNDYLWGGGLISDPCIGIEYIYSSSQTVVFEEEAQYNVRLDYNTEEVQLPFYTETQNPLFVKLTRAVPDAMLPGWVHVWINNGDEELTNEAPDYYAKVPLEAGKEEYEFSVDLSDFSEGSYRMRVAIFAERDLEIFMAGDTVQYGRATDVAAEVTVGENTESNDLNIELTPIVSGAGLSDQQAVEITITNLGYTAVSDVKVSLTADGGAPVEEVVAGPIEPFGTQSVRYTFTQTVDLSRVGKHEIEVSLVAPDGNASNNTARTELFSLPLPRADELYELDFQGQRAPGEAIDFSRVSSLRALSTTDAITLEGWFYLREKQNAVLFETPTLVVGTAKMRREVPDNSLVVLVGNGQRCYSKLPVLTPGQYHQLVVSLSTTRGSFGYMTKVTAFVDGKAVDMVQRGEDIIIFEDLKVATNLDGRVKMVRFWNRELSGVEVSENMHKSVRDSEGRLAEGCVAEFMMNEGELQYLVSGKELAGIESGRVDASADNIWQRADRLIGGTRFAGQQKPAERKSDGKWEVTMAYNVDASCVTGDILTLWDGTEVTYNGGAVTEGTKFNFEDGGGKIVLTARRTLFGVPIEERDVEVKFVRDKSHECDLLRLGLSDNANLKAPQEVNVTSETVVLRVEDKSSTERVDLSRCVLELAEFSAGAQVVYVDREGTSHKYTEQGEKVTVDLTQPVVFTIVSANGRGIKSYTIEAQRAQEVQWDNEPLSIQFSASTTPLDAESSSGNVVRYLAADEHVVTVDAQGHLHPVGVGATTLYASVPGGGGYAESNGVERRVSVTPAPLTIRPSEMVVEEGSEIPSVELEFEGLHFEEPASMFKTPRYEVLKDAFTAWTPDMPPLEEGEYVVRAVDYAAPYREGNYLVTLEDGRLRVKSAVDNKRIEFTVADGRSAEPLEGAEVTLEGVRLQTDAAGKVRIYMPRGLYQYVVSFSGYAPMRGEVEMGDEDVFCRVALSVLGAPITYKTDGKGSILGAAEQRPAYGAYGSEVVAVPRAGCEFVGWSDGREAAMRRDKGQAEAAEYTALFKEKVFTLTYSVSEGGEWAFGERQQRVSAGARGATVGVKASEGCFFAGWSDGVATLERSDAAEGDLSVEARFYKAFALPLVESFDGERAMPQGWTVENYSKHVGSAQWRVDVKSDYPVGAHYKAFMDANAAPKSARNNAALLTPWISLRGVAGDIELSFDWYYKAERNEKVELQYRTEEGVWEDVGLTLAEEPEGVRMVCEIARVRLSGEYVQFRWRYEAGWGYGVGVDNVLVQEKGAARAEYVAGAHGMLKRGGATSASAARVVLAGSELGEPVTAVADAGYRFVAWSDGLRTATRSDMVSGRFAARFGKRLHTLAYDGGEGQIVGVAYQQVEAGSDGGEVRAVAPSGMAFARWSDGTVSNPRRDVQVEEDVSVSAEYGDAVSVVYGVEGEGELVAEVNGSRQEGGEFEVVEGTEVRFIARPADGYRVESWEGVEPRTPDAGEVTVAAGEDVTVKVRFARARFTLVYAAKAGEGRIAGASSQTVNYGEDGAAVCAVPEAGYHFKGWSDGVSSAQRVERSVRKDVDVWAEFGKVVRLDLIVQSEGVALTGARVMLGGYGEKTTDGQGIVAFDVAEGEYEYAVSKEGYEGASGTVSLGADGATVRVSLVKTGSGGYPPTATLTILVRDQEGPLGGATVKVGDKTLITGADGIAAFDNLACGAYSYTVSKRGYVTATGEAALVDGGSVVEVMLAKDVSGASVGELEMVTLRPNPARSELYVSHAERAIRLRVVTLQGEVLLEQRNAGRESEVRVSLEGLAEGVYLLEVSGEGSRRALPFAVVR